MKNRFLSYTVTEPEHNRQVIAVLTKAVFSMSLIIVGLCAGIVFLWVNSSADNKYFIVDEKGQIIEILSHDTPTMTSTKRAGWVLQQVMEAMTFSFTNWESELAAAEEGFDEFAWIQFFQQLEQMGWWGRIRNERLNLRTLPTGAPFLVEESYIEGRQRWVYEVPLLHDWEGANGARSGQRTVAIVTVESIALAIAPAGLVIVDVDVTGVTS